MKCVMKFIKKYMDVFKIVTISLLSCAAIYIATYVVAQKYWITSHGGLNTKEIEYAKKAEQEK